MIVDPENMVLDTLFVQLCAILADGEKLIFNNGDTNLHIRLSQTHVMMSKIVVLWSLTLKTWVCAHYLVRYLQ